MEYEILLGMKEEEVVQYLAAQHPQLKYHLSFTVDPLQKEEHQEKVNRIEKRVIRIKKRNDFLEILIGYFKLPDYILG